MDRQLEELKNTGSGRKQQLVVLIIRNLFQVASACGNVYYLGHQARWFLEFHVDPMCFEHPVHRRCMGGKVYGFQKIGTHSPEKEHDQERGHQEIKQVKKFLFEI